MPSHNSLTNQELLTELEKRLPRFTSAEFKTLVSFLATADWKPLILYVKKTPKANRKQVRKVR